MLLPSPLLLPMLLLFACVGWVLILGQVVGGRCFVAGELLVAGRCVLPGGACGRQVRVAGRCVWPGGACGQEAKS